MRNLKIGGRLNLLNLIALMGLVLVLILSLQRLGATVHDDIADRTRKNVEIAHSSIAYYQKLEVAGEMSREQAQKAASDAISAMRYGSDDHFWIIDTSSQMIAHPMQPEIVGTDVSKAKDADGQFLHKNIIAIVRTKGEGFLEYRWQAAGENEAQAKMAFVKGFEPWGWAVGTAVKVDAVRSAVSSAAWSLGSVILVILLAVGALNWRISRSVAAPLTAMVERMRGLAAGDVGVDIPSLDRPDELGEMARALAVFRKNALVTHRVEAERAEAVATQSFVVETLSNNLARVSEGDLTTEIKVEFPPAYDMLKINFNKAVGALHDLIEGLAHSAHAIRNGADEIAQASDDLARRTESNSASLEEASAALSQMEERLRMTATSAGRTAERTDEATSIVGHGRATADEAVGAMGRVAGGAQGIDSVIEGLDKIAFQTQVLAMNAAVEAGRAGEAGRGFAVVADLVSALARRSEEEARRAREELTATQADITTAVEAVHKVDRALANIMDSVEEVHELVVTMAADNQAQSATISEITIAVGTMDTSTQQNAAMVEETSAATRNLVNEVVALSDSAGRFKTIKAAPISKPLKAVPALMAISAPRIVAEPAKVALTVSDDDDWAEF